MPREAYAVVGGLVLFIGCLLLGNELAPPGNEPGVTFGLFLFVVGVRLMWWRRDPGS